MVIMKNKTAVKNSKSDTDSYTHTPSIAFQHLSLHSARFGYATKGALFISAQLSSDAVSAFWKVRVLIRLWKQPSAQACP